MPKVSVIVPVYGVEKYIERCAQSLFEQTLEDIEFIFVDDCTPDKSIEILKNVLEEYPQRKKQVKIVSHEKNMGLPIARQSGLKVASGDYIIHCDSDDWVDVTMYEKMYNKAIEDGSDVVVCDYVETDGEHILKTVKGCGDTDVSNFIQRMLFKRDPWPVWNKLFKRTVYSKDLIYPKRNMGEDMAICIQMMLQCKRMSYIPKLYYYYYFNTNSITNMRDVNHIISKFEQLKSNTDILLSVLGKTAMPNKKWAINALQYNAKATLINLIHRDKKYYNLWMNTYNGGNWMFIINPFVEVENRLKCLLAILKLYPQKKNRV